jgi:hypothetical protein
MYPASDFQVLRFTFYKLVFLNYRFAVSDLLQLPHWALALYGALFTAYRVDAKFSDTKFVSNLLCEIRLKYAKIFINHLQFPFKTEAHTRIFKQCCGVVKF